MIGNKEIWIVNYYSSLPEYETNFRHIEFAKYLIKNGYNVKIICSGYLSGRNLKLIPKGKLYYSLKRDEIDYILLNVCRYNGNGIRRMLSIFQFSIIIGLLIRKFGAPSIILHNIHAPFDFMVPYFINKKYCRYYVEVWDLWPLSFVSLGLVNASNPLVKFAYYIEKVNYLKADKIIFTFEGGIDYLKDRNLINNKKINEEQVYYINNGVNIKLFNKNITLKKYNDPDLDNDNFFKIIYIGSIKYANNLLNFIDAALYFKENKKVKFLIYGDGIDRPTLEKQCKENSLENVIFKDKRVSYDNIPYILSKSNLNILNYHERFGEYGISSGKLFLYLASGKPIISNISQRYCIINKYNLGISKQFKNGEEYSFAINDILNLSKKEYENMCIRVLNTAHQFDYENQSKKLLNIINDDLSEFFKKID